jgi:hypothetical protein
MRIEDALNYPRGVSWAAPKRKVWRPHYDPPVHVCSVCGARAHFAIGYGKSSPGIWFCRDHYPADPRS